MNNILKEDILSLYSVSKNQVAKEFEENLKEDKQRKDYSLYYAKAISALNELDIMKITNECNAVKKQVRLQIEKINNTKDALSQSCKSSSSAISNIPTTQSKNSISQMSKLKETAFTLLNKIEELDENNAIDSIKKGSEEFKRFNEAFLLQPLMNALIEKNNFYSLVKRERNSKQKVFEEKQATYIENQQKIERLTKEFKANQEKMCQELQISEGVQKEIVKLSKELMTKKNMNVIEVGNFCFNTPEIERKIMKVRDMMKVIEIKRNQKKRNWNEIIGRILIVKMEMIKWEIKEKSKREKMIEVLNKEKMNLVESMRVKIDGFKKAMKDFEENCKIDKDIAEKNEKVKGKVERLNAIINKLNN